MDLFCYSRVVLSGENSEPKYSNYLCFVVSVQTNKLMSEYGGKEITREVQSNPLRFWGSTYFLL